MLSIKKIMFDAKTVNNLLAYVKLTLRYGNCNTVTKNDIRDHTLYNTIINPLMLLQ
jgi:hypothetical protein